MKTFELTVSVMIDFSLNVLQTQTAPQRHWVATRRKGTVSFYDSFILYFIEVSVWPFYTPLEKCPITGPPILGSHDGVHRLPALLQKRFHQIFIKLNENVCGHNILAKFNNWSNPLRHSSVLALELYNKDHLNLVPSQVIEHSPDFAQTYWEWFWVKLDNLDNILTSH